MPNQTFFAERTHPSYMRTIKADSTKRLATNEPKRLRLAYAAWLAVCFFWGAGYLAIRVGVRTMPPMLFVGLRILAAGAILFGVLVATRRAVLPRRSDWVRLGIIGVLTETVSNGVLSWSGQWLTSGLMSLLSAMAPFWMVGIEAATREGERLTARTAFAVLFGFGGLVALVEPSLRNVAVAPKELVGCALIQVVCASYALGSVYTKRVRVDVSPLMNAAVQMIVGGAVLTLVGTGFGEWGRFDADRDALAAFGYLLVFGSLVGYSSYVYALRTLPIAFVALHRYINPAVAVFLGWLILSEPLSSRTAFAVALIAVGVALVPRRGDKRA